MYFGQKICRLQICGNLHWYRYPLTLKKKIGQIPRGERFCYASPRSMKLFFLYFQLLCFCCNISLHALYQIFTVISYPNLMSKEINKKLFGKFIYIESKYFIDIYIFDIPYIGQFLSNFQKLGTVIIREVRLFIWVPIIMIPKNSLKK